MVAINYRGKTGKGVILFDSPVLNRVKTVFHRFPGAHNFSFIVFLVHIIFHRFPGAHRFPSK